MNAKESFLYYSNGLLSKTSAVLVIFWAYRFQDRLKVCSYHKKSMPWICYKTSMSDAKPTATPFASQLKLDHHSGQPLSQADSSFYRSIVGGL